MKNLARTGLISKEKQQRKIKTTATLSNMTGNANRTAAGETTILTKLAARRSPQAIRAVLATRAPRIIRAPARTIGALVQTIRAPVRTTRALARTTRAQAPVIRARRNTVVAGS